MQISSSIVCEELHSHTASAACTLWYLKMVKHFHFLLFVIGNEIMNINPW